MKLFWNNNKTELKLDDIRYEIENSENEKVIRVLEEIGIESVDEYGRTALIWACFAENIELIVWLLEKNANVNHQDNIGYSALHFVAQERRTKSAEYLLAQNAQTELKDKYENTPLWTAVMNAKENLSIVELLLKNKANLDNINKANRTPRQMAEKILGEEFQKLKRKLELK
ncbi:ankyrin repeat domain-containing protein [Flavobacterium psychrophilum]